MDGGWIFQDRAYIYLNLCVCLYVRARPRATIYTGKTRDERRRSASRFSTSLQCIINQLWLSVPAKSYVHRCQMLSLRFQLRAKLDWQRVSGVTNETEIEKDNKPNPNGNCCGSDLPTESPYTIHSDINNLSPRTLNRPAILLIIFYHERDFLSLLSAVI